MIENFDMDQRGGGDHRMHVVPPLVLRKNSKIETLVFKMKKMLVFMKGNSLPKLYEDFSDKLSAEHKFIKKMVIIVQHVI